MLSSARRSPLSLIFTYTDMGYNTFHLFACNCTLQDAQVIGDEFLQLEKYVNLNYMGFHKILKKHDKNLPQSPCRQFYISHLHNQPWVQGNYSDLLVALSQVYSELRGDVAPGTAEDAEDEHYRYSITKYWVSMGDVSSIKHQILQHLPVYQFNEVRCDHSWPICYLWCMHFYSPISSEFRVLFHAGRVHG